MRISAIVLNHGNWPGVMSTVESLLHQSHRLERLVLVDNASQIVPVGEIGRTYPAVDVVVSDRNLGYGGGMNLGIARSPTGVDAYLLVTHECLVDGDVVAGLTHHLANAPDVAIVAPRLVYRSQPDVLWSAGGGLDRRTWEPRRFGWGDRSDDWADRGPTSVAWVDGACWMIRAAAYDAAGPLDEDFFLYYEEATYCFRVRELGWEVVCLPELRALQEPSEVPFYLQARSWLRFVSRTAPRLQVLRSMWSLVQQVGRRLRRGERRVALSQAAGMVAFLLGRSGPTPRLWSEPRRAIRPPGTGVDR